MSADGKQSREVRDLKSQGQATLTWGLANPVSEGSVVGVGLLLRERMSGKSLTGAGEAAGLAAQMLDKTTSKMAATPNLACTKGCNYCCHSVVSVSPPEVFRIATAVRAQGAAAVKALQERIAARADLNLDGLLAKRLACPLLVDGDCGVHDVRPMGCRQYFSTSVEECRDHFEGRRSVAPFVGAAANAGLIARSLLLSAAISLGLKTEVYELGSALGVALGDDRAEQRWLAGDDVFAGATVTPAPPNMQSSVQRWGSMLKGLIDG